MCTLIPKLMPDIRKEASASPCSSGLNFNFLSSGREEPVFNAKSGVEDSLDFF